MSTIVLTGATSGIGRAAARLLARESRCLILHGRKPVDEVGPLVQDLRLTMTPGAALHYLAADFSDVTAVGNLSRHIAGLTDRIDLVINNAGRAAPSRRTITPDGNEVTLQVNYLAAVALTTELLPLLGTAGRGRIVNVASATHYSVNLDLDDLDLRTHRYGAYESYANSKLALVTYSCWLAANRPTSQLEVVSMHPGGIATKILREMMGGGGEAPEVGAEHVRYVAARSGDNGAYYDKRRRVPPNSQASDHGVQNSLMEQTFTLLRDRIGLAG